MLQLLILIDLTLPISELLQGKEIDMVGSFHLLNSLKSAILSKRNTVDEFHNNCYMIIYEISNKGSINKTKPHAATFQKHRNNVPSESVSNYF